MHGRESIVRIVIVMLMLYSFANFASVKSALEDTEKRAELLRREQEQLLLRRSELMQRFDSGLSSESIAAMARDRLGLVMPDETVFYFTEDREEK